MSSYTDAQLVQVVTASIRAANPIMSSEHVAAQHTAVRLVEQFGAVRAAARKALDTLDGSDSDGWQKWLDAEVAECAEILHCADILH